MIRGDIIDVMDCWGLFVVLVRKCGSAFGKIRSRWIGRSIGIEGMCWCLFGYLGRFLHIGEEARAQVQRRWCPYQSPPGDYSPIGEPFHQSKMRKVCEDSSQYASPDTTS